MNNLNALLLSASALSANATTVDWVINTALVYGPGVLLAAVTVCAWHACRWVADRRHNARTTRPDIVADRADTYLNMPRDLVNAQLEAQYNAPAHTEREQ